MFIQFRTFLKQKNKKGKLNVSTRIGFVLIPEQKTLEKIVDIETRTQKKFPSIQKQGQDSHPYITIFQNTFMDNIPYSTLLAKIAIEFTRLQIDRLQFGDVIYEPDGMYYKLLQKTDKLQELHEYAIYHTKKYITDISSSTDQKLPYWQKIGLLEYGYRYAGEAYMPHITIAKTPESTRNDRIIESLKNSLKGLPKETEIQKIAACRIDKDGTYLETLSEIILLPCKDSLFVSY